MISKIQKYLAFFIVFCFVVLLAGLWPNYFLFYLPFLLAAYVYITFLAIQFVVIHGLNRTDPEPRATLNGLATACLHEALAAPKVFLWMQPFRTQTIPDYLPAHASDAAPTQAKPGVVFIHGFFCNRAFWSPWMQQLTAEKRAFAAVTLEPAFGSIDDYVPLVEAAVAQVTLATGQAPMLICHSMGGLAARAWLRANAANDDRIQRVVTIGSPHFGTVLSRKKAVIPFINTQQMQRFSAWTQQLAKDEPHQRYAKFTCWYSNCDNIVVPTSTAMLPGADNRLVTAQGHVSMAFDARVMQESLALR